MSRQIAVRLPDDDLARLDAAVARGAFPSRASAVRAGVQRVLREQREREIEDAYRRGYAKHPIDAEDEAVGHAGLLLGAELIRRQERREE